MKHALVFSLVGMMGLVVGTAAQGALLGLTDPTSSDPDFTSSMDVSYNHTTGAFTGMGGQTDGYVGGANDSATQLINSGDYDFSATINNSGQLQSGTVSVYGDIGNGNELLLSGTLTAFGYMYYSSQHEERFEFTFNVTGGDPTIKNDFLNGALPGEIIMTADFVGPGSTAFSSWNANFNTVNDNVSVDTFVPEPSTYPLCASFLAALVAGGVRGRKQGATTI